MRLFKQLYKRLSYDYRHYDYERWIGPEDGYNSDGTRRGVHHFVYTCPWYNGLIDWIMFDVFNMRYTYNYTSGTGWHKIYNVL